MSGLGAGGSGYWLNGRSQGAEEARNEGEAKASPGAKHRPAIAMTNVVWQAVQVLRVTGELKVDASNTGAEGNDAKGTWKKINKAFRRRKYINTNSSSGSNDIQSLTINNWIAQSRKVLKETHCGLFQLLRSDKLLDAIPLKLSEQTL